MVSNINHRHKCDNIKRVATLHTNDVQSMYIIFSILFLYITIASKFYLFNMTIHDTDIRRVLWIANIRNGCLTYFTLPAFYIYIMIHYQVVSIIWIPIYPPRCFELPCWLVDYLIPARTPTRRLEPHIFIFTNVSSISVCSFNVSVHRR